MELARMLSDDAGMIFDVGDTVFPASKPSRRRGRTTTTTTNKNKQQPS